MMARNDTSLPQRRYAIDSCCCKSHVITNEDVLAVRYGTSQWKKCSTVEGIAPGHKLQSVAAGEFSTVDGLAIVAPDADLLSLMELVKNNNGTLSGNKDCMARLFYLLKIVVMIFGLSVKITSSQPPKLTNNCNIADSDLVLKRTTNLLEEPNTIIQTIDDNDEPTVPNRSLLDIPRLHLTADELKHAKE